MPVIRFLPDDKSIEVRSGTSILDAGRKARVFIRTRCGGNASCLMCKVTVDDQSGLQPPTNNERLKLGGLLEQGVRLSCQSVIKGNVTAKVPEDPLKAAVRAQLMKQREEDDF